ncbi:MAG: molecular chaperone DnaK, partial [Pseudonocardiaceae bacterium]
KLPADVKDKVNAALGEAQEALKGTDTGVIRAAMEKLATESQALGQALYNANPAAGSAQDGSAGTSTDGAAGPPGADDVVDAEIVDEHIGSDKK